MVRVLLGLVLSIRASSQPVIDLASPDASTALVNAAQEWGFAYVKGHEMSVERLSDAERAARDFFGLSQEEKNTLLADKSKALKTARGYAGVRGEQLDVSREGRPDLKEVLDIGLARSGGADPHLGTNQLPNLPEFRSRVEAYGEDASLVAQRVLDLVAQGLGAPGAFDVAFTDPLRVQRLTRYPSYAEILPHRADPAEISCGAHSDYGALTVLHADRPGLAVLRPAANGTASQAGTFFGDLTVRHLDEWIDVPPMNGALVVMFGEALQVLTNGKVQSTKHRVDVDGGSARQSLTFFYDPNPDFMLKPLPAFLDDDDSLFEPRLAGHKGVALTVAATLMKSSFVGYGKV